MPRRKTPAIPDALLDQLLAGADPRSALESDGLIDSLKKALAERALNAEMDHHLAGEGGADNRRNGYGRKTVLTGDGRIGAVLFEQNDDWQSQHRYMPLEAFSQIDAAQIDPLLSISTQAA